MRSGSFALHSALSRSVSLFWDDGESSSLLPLTFHLVSPASPFEDIIAFLRPLDPSFPPRPSVWLSGAAEASVWRTVWIEAPSQSLATLASIGFRGDSALLEAYIDGERVITAELASSPSVSLWNISCISNPLFFLITV